MTTTLTTRFRYIDPTTDVIYVGEAEIEDDGPIGDNYPGCVTLLNVWQYGMTVDEVFPYTPAFPINLRRMLEIAAKEQTMCPPAVPVELPTDWDALEILDTEITYTVAAKSIALPSVKTDAEAKVYGLSTVRRIVPVQGAYKVTAANASYDDLCRDLHKARLF